MTTNKEMADFLTEIIKDLTPIVPYVPSATMLKLQKVRNYLLTEEEGEEEDDLLDEEDE